MRNYIWFDLLHECRTTRRQQRWIETLFCKKSTYCEINMQKSKKTLQQRKLLTTIPKFETNSACADKKYEGSPDQTEIAEY